MISYNFTSAGLLITYGPCFQAPRVEAMSILGSLLCFPNHLQELPVLQPKSGELSIMMCSDVKVGCPRP